MGNTPILYDDKANYAAISGKKPSIYAYPYRSVAFFFQIVKLRRPFIYSPRPCT